MLGDEPRLNPVKLIVTRRREPAVPPNPEGCPDFGTPTESVDLSDQAGSGWWNPDGEAGASPGLPGTSDQTPFPDLRLAWPLPPDLPAAPAPAVVRAPCPGCGGELTSVGKAWCLRCGFDPEQAQGSRTPAPEKSRTGQVVAMLLVAAVGCLAIVLASVFRRDIVPDRTDLRVWWIGFEGLAGFLLYWVGHATAVALTARHWSDPQPSCFDPLAVWRYALIYLPRTRWAIAYGLWGGTAFACAFVLFWLNDFELKDRTAKPPFRAYREVLVDEPSDDVSADRSKAGDSRAGSPSDNSSRNNRSGVITRSDEAPITAPRLPRRPRSGTAVVIGYVPDQTDPSRIDVVMLGTREPDGTIRYAGVAQLDRTAAEDDVVRQLRALPRPSATPGYELGRGVVPVEPTLTANIQFAGQNDRGILQDTVVTGVGSGENANGPER
jgi:hypothetical protein